MTDRFTPPEHFGFDYIEDEMIEAELRGETLPLDLILSQMSDTDLDDLRLDLEHDIEHSDDDTCRMAMQLEAVETEIAWRFGVAVGAV